MPTGGQKGINPYRCEKEGDKGKRRVRQVFLYPSPSSTSPSAERRSSANSESDVLSVTSQRQYVLPNRIQSPRRAGTSQLSQSKSASMESINSSPGTTSEVNNPPSTITATETPSQDELRLPPVTLGSAGPLNGSDISLPFTYSDQAAPPPQGTAIFQSSPHCFPSQVVKLRASSRDRAAGSLVSGTSSTGNEIINLLQEVNSKLSVMHDDIKKIQVQDLPSGSALGFTNQKPHSAPRSIDFPDPHPPDNGAGLRRTFGKRVSPPPALFQQLTTESITETAESILSNNPMLDSPSSTSSSDSSSSSSCSTHTRKALEKKQKKAITDQVKKPKSFLQTPIRLSASQTPKPLSPKNGNRGSDSVDKESTERKVQLGSAGGSRKRQPVANFQEDVVIQDAEEAGGEGTFVVAVGRKRGGFNPEGHRAAGGRAAPRVTGGEGENAKAAEGGERQHRRRSIAIRSKRECFFSPLPFLTDIADVSRLGDRSYMDTIMLSTAPCSWLCCISTALTFVSGVPTPIEEILRVNHMAVHYIALSSITLSEMFDLIQDYIMNKFHSDHTLDECKRYLTDEQMALLNHIHVEMATFDTDLVDIDGADETETLLGERAPISDPVMFRKELIKNVNEENSLYIFNYDPYIIEEEEIRLKCNLAETEEEQEKIRATARYPKSSKGNFGILVDFNAVQHTVTILTPHLTIDQHPMRFSDDFDDACPGDLSAKNARREWFSSVFSNTVVEEHTISLQAMYRAVHQRDPYSKLHRGFVRVFVNKQAPPSITPLFPLFVLDGSSSGGLLSVLDVNIAPHILGLSMTHHLAVVFLLGDSARRKQSSRNLLNKVDVCDVTLRGFPVTKIIQQLRLPLSMSTGDSKRESIAMVFSWYTAFLRQLQINHDVRIGLLLPERRGGAVDGSPNISEETFISHLQLCINTQSVMLLSFDINAALNVKISSRPEPTHFAVLIGIDIGRGIMRVADVNVKRFRKTWHLPIARMYHAIMGYGYMVAAKDKSTIRALNGKQFQEAALSQAKYNLPPLTKAVKRFEYPNRPYPITVLADAAERLGFLCDVERMMNFSGFHISYFLSRHMPLEGAAMVLQNFSHYALDDALSIKSHHYVYWAENLPANEPDPQNPKNPFHRVLAEDDLISSISFALEKTESRMLVIKYDQEIIASDPTVWNGSDGSAYAIAIEYDARRRVVVLSNADVSTYHRTFACPISLLFAAVCSWDAEAQSSCGTILLDRSHPQDGMYENTKGYDLAHSLVHHPFKPIFSSTCACLALAISEMMRVVAPQSIDKPLNPREAERLKYKRYTNIFSAEDVLYALPNSSVLEWKSVPSRDLAQTANTAFQTLHLPLMAINVCKERPDIFTSTESFLKCCDGPSGVLTIVLVAYDTDLTHGIPGNAVGIVNRVEYLRTAKGGGMIQLVNGDPCRWGAYLECSAEQLMKAAFTVVCIQEVDDPEEEY